jgi:hypothetical protein
MKNGSAYQVPNTIAKNGINGALSSYRESHSHDGSAQQANIRDASARSVFVGKPTLRRFATAIKAAHPNTSAIRRLSEKADCAGRLPLAIAYHVVGALRGSIR